MGNIIRGGKSQAAAAAAAPPQEAPDALAAKGGPAMFALQLVAPGAGSAGDLELELPDVTRRTTVAEVFEEVAALEEFPADWAPCAFDKGSVRLRLEVAVPQQVRVVDGPSCFQDELCINAKMPLAKFANKYWRSLGTFGNLEVAKISSISDKVPPEWLKENGLVVGMSQLEACSVEFYCSKNAMAIRAYANGKNALSGKDFSQMLCHSPRDYMVSPPQHAFTFINSFQKANFEPMLKTPGSCHVGDALHRTRLFLLAPRGARTPLTGTDEESGISTGCILLWGRITDPTRDPWDEQPGLDEIFEWSRKTGGNDPEEDFGGVVKLSRDEDEDAHAAAAAEATDGEGDQVDSTAESSTEAPQGEPEQEPENAEASEPEKGLSDAPEENADT
eukprot:m51a1_g3002 hypothetical protein (390) ;mRNA; r:782472-787172